MKEDILNKIYNGRRKAVQNNELNLKEFSSEITNTERKLINKYLDEYEFIRSTKSQIIIKKENKIFKLARFGCGDETYDGIEVNKKEIKISYKYQSKDIFPYPEEQSSYAYETKYIQQINKTELPHEKINSAFTYLTDVLTDIDEVNAFKLKRSQIGYDENNVYVLDYGHLVNSY